MLNRANKILISSFSIEKKLFIYDSGKFDPFVSSGIRATIFGPTGNFSLIKALWAGLLQLDLDKL